MKTGIVASAMTLAMASVIGLCQAAPAPKAPDVEKTKSEPTAEQPKKIVPAFSSEEKEEFFEAQAGENATQLLLERTQQFKDHEAAHNVFMQVVIKDSKKCGAEYQFMLDPQTKKPICGTPPSNPQQEQPKPATKAPAPAKK